MPPAPSVAAALLSPGVAQTIVYPTSEDVSILDAWISSCLGVDGTASQADASYGPPSSDGGGAPDVVADAGDGGMTAAPLDGGGPALQIDAMAPPIQVDAIAPAPGLAGFAFVVDGVVQTPLTCPSDNWEFNAVNAAGVPVCGSSGACSFDLDAASRPASVVIVNTGQVPVAYTARSGWSIPYPPGVPTGEPDVLVGVIDPRAQVDITSVFVGGVTAIVRSSQPFSDPDAGKYVGDEGTIPWPGGVAGSGGSSQMFVAQIDVKTTCMPIYPYW